MDKAYNPANEDSIYQLWEKSGAFTPVVPENPEEARLKKEPFTIILPPPNANNPLHAGHALFTVEDIMVRYHRMLGDTTLWLPGTDHAGIETQFVYEKELKKEGKSRFDFDRNTLFTNIFDFVTKNRDVAKNQMKRLGFSLDWTRERFAMDEAHNNRVFSVFKKMVDDGLVYRDEKIVNYCTFCGTAFSNLEVEHKTINSNLWYFKYSPEITVATTRPETLLGDTAVAVNPSDIRYKHLIGTTITLPLVGRQIPIVADDSVDPEFGTGCVKVTPSHSPEDYDTAKRHQLDFLRIIDFDGKFNQNVPQKYQGLYTNQARAAVVADMESAGLLEKTIPHTHEVGHCYKCGRPIEPITAPQWFVKIAPLAASAVDVVNKEEIKFFPKRFKKEFLSWMTDVRDWPISRQIVWGQQIPAWYNFSINPDIVVTFINKDKITKSGTYKELSSIYSYEEIISGLQSIIAPTTAKYYLTKEDALKDGGQIVQETDTFDTWFSSGQWPYSTLGWDPNSNHSPDYKYFYPTSVLDTMWDILFFWVARMVMFGLYTTGQVPFKTVHLHSRVVDAKGQKMSKSKGNVIEPVAVANQYGADALRMALVIGVAPGSDIALSDDKIRAQRNFVNKIWNASRFIEMLIDRVRETEPDYQPTLNLSQELSDTDKQILTRLNEVIVSTTKNLDKNNFGQASDVLYQFFWKEFCDVYIESAKDRGQSAIPVLLTVLLTSLHLLHPFIPYVTENIYQYFGDKFGLKAGSASAMLITSPWPKVLKI